ncbi:hypothetical protein [Alteromonas facilis]|uniref:hypothetical protein n=1 Tax=Alteromonas facilis TaxID=2048004 RepID=UPI000C290488|nr:hypothetical protein [Alteromonas facilis]
MLIDSLSVQLPFSFWGCVLLFSMVGTGWLLSGYWIIRRLKGQNGRLAIVILLNSLVWFLGVLLLSDIKISRDVEKAMVVITNSAKDATHQLQSATELDSAEWVRFLSNNNEMQSHNDDREVATVSHIEALSTRLQDAGTVFIVGDGLSSTHWQFLEQSSNVLEKNINFIPSDSRTGIVRAQWPKHIKLGEFVNLSFSLHGHHSDDSLYRLELVDPMGGALDTQLARVGERLSMQWQPKANGQWLYTLRLIEDATDQEISSEMIALDVTQPDLLNALIVQSAPNFESRHLQNYLVDAGANVTVRSQISKNAFKSQSVKEQTSPQLPTDTAILPLDLLQFDVLAIDWRALENLSESERERLSNAIAEGLGVHLWLADTALTSSLWQELEWLDIGSVEKMREEYAGVFPVWQTGRADKPQTFVSMQLPKRNQTILVSASTGEPLVIEKRWQLGRVALSLLPSTYVVKLEGDGVLYTNYWAELLSRIGRASERPEISVSDQNMPLRANERVQICVSGVAPHAKFELKSYDNASVSLASMPHPIVDGRHCAFAWASETGWHTLSVLEDETQSVSVSQPLYVYAEDGWTSWRQYEASNVTQRVAANARKPEGQQYSTQSQDKYWLFIFWLLGMTLLWVERKWF